MGHGWACSAGRSESRGRPFPPGAALPCASRSNAPFWMRFLQAARDLACERVHWEHTA